MIDAFYEDIRDPPANYFEPLAFLALCAFVVICLAVAVPYAAQIVPYIDAIMQHGDPSADWSGAKYRQLEELQCQ